MTRRLPPLYALRAFEAAARHASFTRAGEELAITQSAVSRHIRTLEEHFGCRLFERHGRQLQLTEPARLLLPGLRDGFDALERACTALRVDDATLRLKAPSTLTLRWLLPRLSRFRHLNPDIEVQAHQCLDGCGLGGLPARAFRLRGVAGQRPVQPGMGNGSAVRRMAGAGLRSRRGRGALDPPTPA